MLTDECLRIMRDQPNPVEGPIPKSVAASAPQH